MRRIKYYYLFLFLSSFSRGLIDVYSLVILYHKGYSLLRIFLFLIFSYFMGIGVSFISIRFHKRFMLIFSNIIYGISFLYLSFMSSSILSLFLFSILFSFSFYSYHVIRHYYALVIHHNHIDYYVIFMYLGSSLSMLIGGFLLQNFAIVVNVLAIVFSFFSIIPIFLNFNDSEVKIDGNLFKKITIGKNKIIFSILEQFKVLFMELQPLYLYLYVSDSFLYIGFFRVVMNISSLIVASFLLRYIHIKYFKYVTFFLGVVLIFKLNGGNSVYMFLIAFLEGMFIKIYEVFSLRNLYNYDNEFVHSYLMWEEFVFLLSKAVILGILFSFGIKIVLYVCIVGIVISGFFIC